MEDDEILRRADVTWWETENLDDHVGLIKRQVDRSLQDPETTRLARALIACRPDSVTAGVGRGQVDQKVRAWGQLYTLAPQEPSCGDDVALLEVIAMWNFAVLNIAYVPDPPGYDLFCTVKKMLERRGEDCDGFTIFFGAMLRAVGFRDVQARVISTDKKRWQHVYTIANLDKTGLTRSRRLALDPTVTNATPGWEYTKAKAMRDFPL